MGFMSGRVSEMPFSCTSSGRSSELIICPGSTIGSLPVRRPVPEGSSMVLGGRRWRVVRVDPRRGVIVLVRAPGGFPPSFSGEGIAVHTRVRERMREVYAGTDRPAYLDPAASELLDEGRDAFRRLGLDRRRVVEHGQDALIFPWTGDAVMGSLALALASRGLRVGHEGVCLAIRGTSRTEVVDALESLASARLPGAPELAARARNREAEKHDRLLPEGLLLDAYAARSLDVTGAWRLVRSLAGEERAS
jgi:ATP-dependent helicase Lhr and Lhr-like helicase